MTSKTLYEEMTWPETQEAGAEGRVAILPTGSTEQHGPHLPLSTDVLCSYSVCKKVAEAAPSDAVVFPPVWYGVNEHHADFREIGERTDHHIRTKRRGLHHRR